MSSSVSNMMPYQTPYFASPMQQQQLHPSFYGMPSQAASTGHWIGASTPFLASSSSSSAAAHYQPPAGSMASFGSQSSSDDMIQSPVLTSHSGAPPSSGQAASSSTSQYLAASDSFALNEERLPSTVAPALYFASPSSSCGVVSTSTSDIAYNPSSSALVSIPPHSDSHSSAASTTDIHSNKPLVSNRFKRPREEFAADSQFFHSDNTLHTEVSDAQPPLKRQHNGSSVPFVPSVTLPAHSLAASGDNIVSDNEDDVMISPQSMSGSCSPSPVCISDNDSNGSPVDGEIDTDQWNLSKLRLEVNNEFQPLLNRINSHNAKNAAGFESDNNSIFELHREVGHKRNTNSIVRAVWDKNSTYNCVTADGTIKHFAPSSEAPQQSLILYNSRQRTPTLRSAPHSNKDPIVDFDLSSNGFSGANNSRPVQYVRSSPIITEDVDDNESHYSHNTLASTSSTSIKSIDSSVHNDMSDVRTGLSLARSASPSAHASAVSAPSFSSLSSASAHVLVKRLEKRRRDSDSDMSVSASLRIEEIHDDEVQAAKKQKLKAAVAAATISSADSTSSRRTSIVSDSDMASGDESTNHPHHVTVSTSSPSSVESPQQSSFNASSSFDFVQAHAGRDSKHGLQHQPSTVRDEEKETPFVESSSSQSRPLNGWMTADRQHQHQHQHQQQQRSQQQQHTVHHMIW